MIPAGRFQRVRQVGAIERDAHALRLRLHAQPLLERVQRVRQRGRQQAVFLLGDGGLELFRLVQAAQEQRHLRLLEQARLDQELEVVHVRLQQEQIRQLRLWRDRPDLARGLGADVFDHALAVGRGRIRQVAVARVEQDAHRVLQAAVGHALDGPAVEQPVLKRADARAGICAARLLHTRPSHQPNSRSATFVSSLSRSCPRMALKEQSFS